jgi:hypothetical protein
MFTLHTRRDWHRTNQKFIDLLICAFRLTGTVPKIDELCKRYNICARTLKKHKPHFNLKGLLPEGKISQAEYEALAPKWEGVRPYRKVNSPTP